MSKKVTIGLSKMPYFLEIAHLSNDSVHMLGLHGLGKSDIVKSFARERDFHIEILMLAQNEVVDLIGSPYDEEDEFGGKVQKWSKPIWFHRLEEANRQGKHCLLFMDELARGPLEVRQCALQLALDGRIHEHHLPTKDGLKTLVVAADNPADLYQTDELDSALLDRFATYNIVVDVRGWLNWANSNNIEPVITDYIADFPDNLHNVFNDSDDKGATPRSWAKLSDILKNIKVIPENLHFHAIESKIGEVIGNNFYLYYKDYVKVLKVDDFIEMIGDESISTAEEQKRVAERVSRITQEIEALSSEQLAEKMKSRVLDKTLSPDVLTVFLGSLKLEVLAGIVKKWKESSDQNVVNFYFDYAEKVPEFWIFVLITSKKN